MSRRLPRRLPRRVLLAALVTGCTLVAIWVAAGYRVLGHPRLDTPTRADAVIVLGPQDEKGGFTLGEQLVNQGVAPNLLLSIGSDQRGLVGHTCGGDVPPPAGNLTCFVADPDTTRGEARELARQAQLHGWRTVIVVTPTYHVERARMIFERCFGGRLELVAPQQPISAATWAYEFFYQSAGFAKMALQSGC